jgi:EmrB/QacA subfamily drug resistance transporter
VSFVTQVSASNASKAVDRRAWKILGATSLTNFVVGLDLSVTNVAIPDMQREFSAASTADLSWVLTFYMVTYAGLLIVAGRWADRFGRLRMLNIGIAFLVAGAALAAIAPSLPMLVAMRGLQGAGAAMMTPASVGLAIAAFPVERRGTAVAIWSSTLALSSIVGPILGGVLIEVGSWRWAYTLVPPMGAVALVWGIRVLSESTRDPNARTPDAVGSALVGVTTGGVALAIVQGSDWGWTSAPVLGLFGAAALSVVVVARRVSRHPDPIVPPAVLKVSSFRVASCSLFLFGLGFFPVILTMVLYLTEIAGYSTAQAGLAISMLPVAATICANIAGHVADRFGFRTVAVPGMLLFTAGALWLFLRAGEDPNYLVDVLPGLVLLGCAIGSGPTILAGAAVSEVDRENFSVAGAVNQTARQLAGAIGLAVLVAILRSADTDDIDLDAFRRAFIYLGTVAGLASLVATRLPSPTRSSC